MIAIRCLALAAVVAGFIVSTTATGWSASAATLRGKPPVDLLDSCRPGPHCFYGPIYAKYQTYGNVSTLGDCTFASVADWEQVVLRRHPKPAIIEREFREAGGSARGLYMSTVFRYWSRHGIGGVHLRAAKHVWIQRLGTPVSNWTVHLERAIRRYKALLVVFKFENGDAFGQFFAPSGYHTALVDGFTPEGPLVVTWGKTIQLDWNYGWYSEAVQAWRVAAAAG